VVISTFDTASKAVRRAMPGDLAAAMIIVIPPALAYLVRITLYSSVPADEAEWLVSAQTWRWSYDVLHPSLNVWLGRIVQLAVGGGYYSLLALKFSVLSGFYLFTYLSARHVLGPGLGALAVTTAPMGMVYVAWEPLMSYTHSVLVLFFCSFSLYALIRLAERQSYVWYGVFGLALALGVMSKYQFLAFIGSLGLALIWSPAWRAVVISPRIVLSIFIFMVISLPQFAAQLPHLEQMRSTDEVALAFKGAQGFLRDRIAGTGSMIEAFLSFSLPAVGLIPLWFFKDMRQPAVAADAPVQRLRDLFWRWFAIMAAGYWLVVVILGITYTRTHHLYFVSLVTFPLVLEAIVRGAPQGKLARFCVLMLALQGAALGALVVRAYAESAHCVKCRTHMPYRDYADQLRNQGFEDGTIVSFSTDFLDIGENLKHHFPHARVFSVKWPKTYPRPSADAETCLILWDQGRAPDMLSVLSDRVVAPLRAAVPADADAGIVSAPVHLSGRPATPLGFVLLPAGNAVCPR